MEIIEGNLEKEKLLNSFFWWSLKKVGKCIHFAQIYQIRLTYRQCGLHK